MAVGCNSCELPDYKDPPFSKAKVYHSEVKPDAVTLKLEVIRQYQAYICKGCQPCPSNWKIDKCLELIEFCQPIQVQSHLEMPGILVQLGHIQRT